MPNFAFKSGVKFLAVGLFLGVPLVGAVDSNVSYERSASPKSALSSRPYKQTESYQSASTLVQRVIDDQFTQDPAKFNFGAALNRGLKVENQVFAGARQAAGYDGFNERLKGFFDAAIRGAQIEKDGTGYRVSRTSIEVVKNLANEYVTAPDPVPLSEGVSKIQFSRSAADASGPAPSPSVSEDPNRWLVVNQDILPVMRSDFQKYFDSSKAGEIRDWAGGKLSRDANGATFVDSVGNRVKLSPKNMDFNDIALKSAAIAKHWAEQYGFKIVAKGTAPKK